MTSAAATQKPKYPKAGEIPSRIAPAAPGNPTRERVWPANVWRRSTMNHPMVAETTATMVPARNAFTMNGKLKSWRRLLTVSSSVPVPVDGWRLRRADHHQLAARAGPDRAARKGGRPDQADTVARCDPSVPAPWAGHRHTPPWALQPETDHVDAPQAERLVEALALGHVADPASLLARGGPQ